MTVPQAGRPVRGALLPSTVMEFYSGAPLHFYPGVDTLQLETEIRIDPGRRADRFVEHWQKLDRANQHQSQAGDMSAYWATLASMGDMANGKVSNAIRCWIPARQSQDRTRHSVRIRPPTRAGTRLQSRHRSGQGTRDRTLKSILFPPSLRQSTTTPNALLPNDKSLS